jgi:hypothetical protein
LAKSQFFLRNPLDRQRITGPLIDHHKRVVLEFHESDLANARLVRGWAEVITMGVSLDHLEKMHPTGESREHQWIQEFIDTIPGVCGHGRGRLA